MKRRTLADDLRDLEASDPAIAKAGEKLDAIGEAMAQVGAVERAHPLVQISPARDDFPGEWARFRFRERMAADYEDLDALPVEEQAAIACAIAASSGAKIYIAEACAHALWNDGENVDVRPLNIAMDALLFARGSDHAERLAEAEARIRTGEVRP